MAATLPDPQARMLRDAVTQAGLSARWEELRERALPAFSAEVTTGEADRPAGCRLGGRPALPGPEHWPTREGRALTFVGQLDLGGFPAADVGLPAEGLLAFFIGVDEPASDVDHEVRYFPDVKALRTCRPPVPEFVNDEQPDFPGCPLVLRPTVVLPESLLWLDLGTAGERLSDLLSPPVPGSEGRSRVGGHPSDHPGSPAHDAYLCSAGRKSILYDWHLPVEQVRADIDRLRREGRDDYARILRSELPDLQWYADNEHRHESEIAHWKVLFEVDSHEAADMMWWDAGRLVFLIDDRDLAQGRFDRTYAGIQTS
ncbi:DUF1963 domain-containing protein [Actinomadura scrupuli]|uniref:DUF1963 domain-containing protein n=1 Tax=Actinomadura scrupuli TaxID=559629 RepID=UPI003D990B1C